MSRSRRDVLLERLLQGPATLRSAAYVVSLERLRQVIAFESHEALLLLDLFGLPRPLQSRSSA